MRLSEFFGHEIKELPPTDYQVFKSSTTDDNSDISKELKLPNYYDIWCDGERLGIEILEPLIYEIEPFDEHGGILCSYMYSLYATLMSKKLISKLSDLGVNNLDTYDAEIHFKRTGEINTDYKAVIIIGAIKASSAEQSICSTSGLSSLNDTSGNTWFDKLVLDENLITDLLLFRMMESVTTVLIYKSLKEALEKEFPDLCFFHPLE